MVTPRSVFWFACAPLQKWEWEAFGDQWAVVPKRFARIYHSLGLIEKAEDVGPLGERGLRAVFAAGQRGWIRKWGPSLARGWQRGTGEGIIGRLGGVCEAVWEGRDEIVRDAVAISTGVSMWLAVCAALGWMFLTGTISTAHAAATSGSDIARTVLGNFFPFLGAGTLLAQGLGQMASVMSTTALWFACAGAIWSSIILAVEYTTKPDSAAQRYTPWLFVIRIGVSIGFLVPLSSGWNLGQVMVGNFGQWGSDKASTAWTSMVTYLGNTKDCGNSSCNWVVKPGVAETDILSTIYQTASAEACKASINLDPARNGDSANGTANGTERVVISVRSSSMTYDYQVKGTLWGWNTETVGGCGTVAFITPTTNAVGSAAAITVANAQKAAYTSAVQGVVAAQVSSFIQNRITCRDAPTQCVAPPDVSTMSGLPAAYRTALESAISDAWETANSTAAQQLATATTTDGWVGAAKWSMTLSNMQGSIDAAGSAMPRVSPPTLNDVGGGGAATIAWLSNGLAANGNTVVQAETSLASGNQGASDDLWQSFGTWVWTSLAQVDSAQPITGLASVGYTTYKAGTAMMAITGAIEGIISLPSGGGSASGSDSALDKAGSAAGSALTQAAGALPGGRVLSLLSKGFKAISAQIIAFSWGLILVGLGLAYLVPALPFIRFYFSVIGWMIAFFECVMLVPLMLVLMVTADTGGFFGSAAKAAVWNVVGLVVRPFFTVSGFVIGLMLISGSIGILNSVMLSAIRNLLGPGLAFAGFVVYMIIYLGIAYVTVNICTKVAESLPMAAYRIIGANASGEQDHGAALSAALGATLNRVFRRGAPRRR